MKREHWGDVTCDDLLAGSVPTFCAGAFEDPTAAGGELLAVVEEYGATGT